MIDKADILHETIEDDQVTVKDIADLVLDLEGLAPDQEGGNQDQGLEIGVIDHQGLEVLMLVEKLLNLSLEVHCQLGKVCLLFAI